MQPGKGICFLFCLLWVTLLCFSHCVWFGETLVLESVSCFFSGCVEVHQTCFCLCTMLFTCFPSDSFSFIHPWISVWYGGFIFLTMFWWLNRWRAAVVTPSFISAGPLTFYLNLLMWFLLDSLMLSSMFPVRLALAPPTRLFGSFGFNCWCDELSETASNIIYWIKHFMMPQYAKSCVFVSCVCCKCLMFY